MEGFKKKKKKKKSSLIPTWMFVWGGVVAGWCVWFACMVLLVCLFVSLFLSLFAFECFVLFQRQDELHQRGLHNCVHRHTEPCRRLLMTGVKHQ